MEPIDDKLQDKFNLLIECYSTRQVIQRQLGISIAEYNKLRSNYIDHYLPKLPDEPVNVALARAILRSMECRLMELINLIQHTRGGVVLAHYEMEYENLLVRYSTFDIYEMNKLIILNEKEHETNDINKPEGSE